MKLKLYILFIVLTVISFSPIQAQSKKKPYLLQLAQNEFNQYRFAYAIPVFKQYLSNQPKDTIALLQLANSYLKVNQYDSAVKYFDIAIEYGVQYKAIMAEAYANRGMYEKATSIYKDLMSIHQTKLTEARFFGFSNTHKFLADSLDFNLFNTKINTEFNEYNSVLYKNGLVYESNQLNYNKRKKSFFLWNILFPKSNKLNPEFAWDGAGFSQLFFYPNLDSIRTNVVSANGYLEKKPLVNYTDYSTATPNDANKLISSYSLLNRASLLPNNVTLFDVFERDKMNIGAVSFTADGKTAYYTRNQKKSANIYQLEIWEATQQAGEWVNAHKMFFNNPKFSYFHPAITPDGKRLYYVTDDNTGQGGTDIYYVERNEDGSWKNTVNLGQDINTAGNELFPTFYEGNLFISSNGHPGLGGLDIYRLTKGLNGEAVVKNMGYPVNSSKDDFAFSIQGTKGFFSTNRNGSDDIMAFDYQQSLIHLKGKIFVDSSCQPGKMVYLYQKNDQGKSVLKDSSRIDSNCNYAFKIRPNQAYDLVAYDDAGIRFQQSSVSEGYQLLDKEYVKEVALINIPLSEAVKLAKMNAETALRNAELAVQTTQFIRTVDSLKSLTKEYVELHHPFDQVYIIEKDLPDYYKVIELVKRLKHKKIVIVSAADCNGAYAYNEDLATRRAQRIYKTLSKLSDNEVVIKQVGERELLKDCSEARKDIAAQVVNRYSYIFIMNKN